MVEILRRPKGFPVSIIIPLQEKRKKFFHQFVLPLAMANEPAEVIIHSGPGNAAQKRNQGFYKSTQPYVMFLDDDKLLPEDCLYKMYAELEQNSNAGYAYTGYTGIVLHHATHPCKSNYNIPTVDFDEKQLRRSNFIDTTSLIRREVFPRFDEEIPQHDDWELYMHMLSKGVKGVAVHGVEFLSFFLDEGITSINNKDCSEIIRKRYAAP